MTVAVFGGGVAGLTVAHELARRGVSVDVYEARAGFGGKCRSIPSDEGVPGEHGHHIFPGFYVNLDRTLADIPAPAGCVLDHLVPTDHAAFFPGDGRAPMRVPTWFPRRRDQVRHAQAVASALRNSTVPIRDHAWVGLRVLQMLARCPERRLEVHEHLRWIDWIGTDARGEAFMDAWGRGPTEVFQALDPAYASARTMGELAGRLLMSGLHPPHAVIRVLDGPLNERWFDPWVCHLRGLGVRFHTGAPLERLSVEGDRIQAAHVGGREIRAAQYVLALPVERVTPLLDDTLVAADPNLGRLSSLKLGFMGGIQFLLDRDVPMVPGHAHYIRAAWAITSVSQGQFWKEDLPARSGGRVAGCVSATIGDWDTPGTETTRSRAMDCDVATLGRETWAQIQSHLPPRMKRELDAARVVRVLFDPVLADPATRAEHLEPLFLNTTGSWDARPEATTALPNLFLASDYVRTSADMTTMEAANEAARRAANGVLAAREGGEAVPVVPHVVPAPLRWAQAVDRWRWQRARAA